MKNQISIERDGFGRQEGLPQAGFTLIEMMGVLAIVVILAAAASPVVVRELDRAAWTKESGDLATISNALTLYIVRSNTVPGTNGLSWANGVATWLNQSLANITLNPRKFNRVFLVDPNSSLIGGYSQTGNSGIPTAPTSARVMVVSTIARTSVPASVDFNETWNWNNVLNPTAKPASWSAFPGTGDDVCIQRINLSPMFYQLVLVNRDQTIPGSINALFSINGNFASSSVVTNGFIRNSYYLAGSSVGLWTTNASGTTYVLNQNASFVFENGTWNGQIGNGATSTNPPPPAQPTGGLAGTYNSAAIGFFNAEWNSAAATQGGKGASQTAVLSAFGNFMLDYTMWADTNPSFDSNGDPNNNLPIQVILSSQKGIVDSVTGNGAGGQANNNLSGLLHQ